MTEARYRLYGSVGSPYALKLRSLFRYRRLPFDWVPASLDWIPERLPHPPRTELTRREIEGVKPSVVPVVRFPQDASYRNDSTLVAMELERKHAERSVIPPDPGWAFLSHLIEDMADEWGVKIAFNYRWGYDQDQRFKSRIVAGELLGAGYDETVQVEAAKHFAHRQVGRMPLVGCTLENQPLIELTYRKVLEIMGALPSSHDFLFGGRPTLADFGWYGELESLRTDPTPAQIMHLHAPGTFQYLQLLEDASGIEADWPDPDSGLPMAARGLLEVAGEVYLPFLHANATAYERRDNAFSFSAYGLPYSQGPFKYQVKCLDWLRQEFAALKRAPRERTIAALRSTRCLEWLDS